MRPDSALPSPAPDALAHSRKLTALIRERIEAAGGWISFADFMEMALYAPALGYYAAGATNFGQAGDFTTAPELSPLFAQCLAIEAAPIMAIAPAILEVGAGSGRLAVDLLRALETLNALPERYEILEISADLRARQQEKLALEIPHLSGRIFWRDGLPERFSGLVLANEVLDAMPVSCVLWPEGGRDGVVLERGVTWQNPKGQEPEGFVWQTRPATDRLLEAALAIAERYPLPSGYMSEVGLPASDWSAAWGGILERGLLLLIDYGFPGREYYLPERREGTLFCHYRHRAHADPFFLPGLQDITAHVDFTAIIEAAYPAGLELLGYTSQARFLINCGLLSRLSPQLASDDPARFQTAAAARKLIEPHEMGEIFKVMALGKGLAAPLIGFSSGDKSHTL
ncbi:MAG: SAM-dependent methyltransferase [Zoogloeaceae bacterium]|jgi:SAM-dependent MidA family methyltransferase|nr:SAM-dependent methyltransferase [Zoogloeaceae bacterium]